jgi:hypothetical protein
VLKSEECNVIDELKVFTDVSSGSHGAFLWNLMSEFSIKDELLEI